MLQATTPTFILTPKDKQGNPIDLSEATVFFSLKQGAVAIKKTGESITVAGSTVSVYLTQEETLPIREGTCEIQLNWTYSNGSRAGTQKKLISVSDNLLKEVV